MQKGGQVDVCDRRHFPNSTWVSISFKILLLTSACDLQQKGINLINSILGRSLGVSITGDGAADS